MNKFPKPQPPRPLKLKENKLIQYLSLLPRDNAPLLRENT